MDTKSDEMVDERAGIENLNRVLSKGDLLPIPLLCTLVFGAPMRLGEGEDKSAFLERARRAVMELEGP